jgi:sortase A
LGRDLQYKLLTLVFALTALLALSACIVASSPSATSSGSADPVETPDPSSDDSVEIEEPVATPEPEVDDSAEPEAADDSDAVTVIEDDPTDDISDSVERDDESVSEPEEVDEQDEEAEPIPGKPVRLQIDAIDVDAAMEYVGVDDDGNMDVPQEWENVAWYEPGTVPGDVGNSVIAGHYDSYTDPAVFFDLNELEVGDIVRVITEDREELEFEVTELELVHVDEADTSKIFGETDERNLNLITCEGAWDPDAGMYDERLIVYTTLIQDDTA